MKASELWPSKYVKAADLNGKPVTLTIKELKIEEMGIGAEKENKPVLYFQKATKGLVLNRTNGLTIASLYGDDVAGWIGQRITIIAIRMKAFGQMTDTIRVKEEIPAQPAPRPSSEIPIEEPTIDDDEDVADPEPDDLEKIWEPTESGQATVRTLSAAQRARIDNLGIEIFGPGWQQESVQFCKELSSGTVTNVAQLLPNEGDVLLANLEKIRSDRAANVQSTKKGVAA